MRKFLAIFLILMLLVVSLPLSVFATSETSTVLKVGFFDFDGYHMIDGNGNRSGYGYELLQRIAGYAGFTYEYVDTMIDDDNSVVPLTWEKAQDLLESGEIDILTSAQKTTARIAKYEFSSLDVGSSSAILTVKSTDTRYVRGDYSSWGKLPETASEDLMVVGVIAGNSRNDGFADFAAENGFDYTPVEYTSTAQMVADLQTGGIIDAVLTSNLRNISGETIIAQFATSPFYVTVDKGNTDLINKVNAAIAQMDIYEPNFRNELMTKYYPSYSNTEVVLDKAEVDYLEANADTVFTAVLNPDCAPYSYLKPNGDDTPDYAGCLYDIALEIIENAGITVRFLDCATREDYWDIVNSGEVDIRFDSNFNYSQNEEIGYWLTPSYMTVSVSRLYLKRTTEFSSAAVIQNGDIVENYAAAFEANGITLTEYTSIDEIIEAVLSGEQDMALLSVNTAEIAVRDDERNRLVSDVAYGYDTSFAVSINSNQDPLLYSIINKSVCSLTDDEIDNYILAHVNDLAESYSFVGYIYDYPVRVVSWFVAGVALIAVVITVIFTIKRRRALVAEIEEDRKRNEILNEALIATQKANEAKSNFMSRISHEIRTPLNAIIGFNSIARSEITEAKTNEERIQAEMKAMDYLSKSELASKHLLTIINDVLDMSAIDSGKISVSHEKFDFTALVASLSTVFYSQATPKGINFEVLFDTLTEEWFIGDQLRVNQVLTNLLSNAIKFTPDGGTVKLTIRQPEAKTNAAHIQFEISDTGIGMAPEFLDKIWLPFEQADSSISRRFGGSGLGLAIVKNLVELLGGTIQVESQVGVGTTFTVDLTFGRTEQPQSNLNYDFSHLNALIVDDDRSTCDYIKLLFTRFGARSTAVTSGKEAIEAFEKASKTDMPFTVCLIDWQMPKMDGLETVKGIKKLADEELPIIIATAYDYSDIAEKAIDLGVSAFVSKPLFQSSLFDMLANICGKPSNKSARKSQKYNFKGARVLLVEDNMMNMEIAKHILNTVNLLVDTAVNGQEAVDVFTNSKPNNYKAILMDIQMPVMDGYTATQTIRASDHPQAKTIPIIAMTADAFAENIEQSIAVGMNAHVSKPIEITSLFETLKEYLGK